MNALIYSIQEINNQIPFELLHVGFTIDEPQGSPQLTSLDDKILNKLLKKRVLLDANIIGGVELSIPLSNLRPYMADLGYTVFNIPPELTMNREVISVLGLINAVAFTMNGNSATSYGMYQLNDNALVNVTSRIANSLSGGGVITNSHIELIGHNTVVIYANYSMLGAYSLRVLIENESNLNNIQPRSYKAFSVMCVLAAKAYLYNKLIISVNSGYLLSGQDLGVFKNVLEGYSDAENQYAAYLTEHMGAVLFMNDVTRSNRYINSMLSPGL